MGCVCCSLSSFVSILLDALERISLCTVCAMLTCCLLFTIITVMVLGIGIGFHYCFVQSSVEAMGRAAKAAGALRSGQAQPGPVMRSVDSALRRGGPPKTDTYRERREADYPPLTNNNTLNRLNSTLLTHNLTSVDYIQFFNITNQNFTNI
ncbi:uncharacterized protein LOC126371845 [Pectinophora gossypiella]|uniref:uncharacterized protein LOC126371845 n=1 Tax=Pectinophora gossypiella TaxID=13191 RepID=UPI00214F4C32|nr:uncharacterized protein LOC126371845 [Pectinophora gossypiella]